MFSLRENSVFSERKERFLSGKRTLGLISIGPSLPKSHRKSFPERFSPIYLLLSENMLIFATESYYSDQQLETL